MFTKVWNAALTSLVAVYLLEEGGGHPVPVGGQKARGYNNNPVGVVPSSHLRSTDMQVSDRVNDPVVASQYHSIIDESDCPVAVIHGGEGENSYFWVPYIDSPEGKKILSQPGMICKIHEANKILIGAAKFVYPPLSPQKSYDFSDKSLEHKVWLCTLVIDKFLEVINTIEGLCNKNLIIDSSYFKKKCKSEDSSKWMQKKGFLNLPGEDASNDYFLLVRHFVIFTNIFNKSIEFLSKSIKEHIRDGSLFDKGRECPISIDPELMTNITRINFNLENGPVGSVDILNIARKSAEDDVLPIFRTALEDVVNCKYDRESRVEL